MRFHHETAAKIRQCCVYIKDDAKIAAYVSSSCEPVAASDVRRIRESMPAYYAPCSGRYTPGSMATNQEPVGLERESRHREDAAQGSAALLKAIAKFHVKRGSPGPWADLLKATEKGPSKSKPHEARPIGELIKPIMAKCEAVQNFQNLLKACPDQAARKHFIMAAWESAVISCDDAKLLIETYQLETA